MRIQIKKSFSHASTSRPFVTDELVTVPDELAHEWIAAGLAVTFVGEKAEPVTEKPIERQRHRERAVRVR